VLLVFARLNKSVLLIIKTTDLSAAGYALSVGSGGVAVSEAFTSIVVILTIAGRYIDPLPIFASPTTRPQLFAKGVFPLTFDARHQHRPHLGVRNRRHLSRQARRRLSCCILGDSQDPRLSSAGSDKGGRRTFDLVSRALCIPVVTDEQLVQWLRQIHGRFCLASDDPKLLCQS